MDTILKKLADNAIDAGSLAQSIAEMGLRSVNQALRGTKIFGALTSREDKEVEFDETHYVLVPILGAKKDYAIYKKRILPQGIGETNSLPKARFFHVPDVSGKELLEQELVTSIVSESLDNTIGASDLADTLEKIADQIDRETDKISGGLLIIGGVVTLINPLLGIGIAVKGLLPAIGAKVSKAGAEYVGGKLRNWNQSTALNKLKKDASKQVRNLKPRMYSNPIIRSIEAIATNPSADFDPCEDRRNWVDEFETIRFYQVTLEAIQEVYKNTWDSLDLNIYQDSHLKWIKSLIDDDRD